MSQASKQAHEIETDQTHKLAYIHWHSETLRLTTTGDWD